MRYDRAVAPPAGAWIETRNITVNYDSETVAPPAGAWIETSVEWFECVVIPVSRPLRARGLKQ